MNNGIDRVDGLDRTDANAAKEHLQPVGGRKRRNSAPAGLSIEIVTGSEQLADHHLGAKCRSALACAIPFSSDLSRTRRLDEDAGDRGIDDDLLPDRLDHDAFG